MTTLKVKDGFAKYTDIKNFIEERIHNLDVVEARANAVAPSADGSCNENAKSKDAVADNGRRHFKQKSNKSARAHVATQQAAQPTAKSTCSFCKGEHFVGFCSKFSSCSQVQRRAHVVSAKLCYNCLNYNHMVDTCHLKGRCLVCRGRHHTKLHQDAKVVSNASATVVENTDARSSEFFNAHVRLSKKTEHVQGMLVPSCGKVLLATACVLLEAPSGQTMTVRALLDSGAEESFLTEYVVQTLSLSKHSANVVVSGVGASTTAIAKSRVSVRLKSMQNTEFCFNLSALVLGKLSSVIPSTEIPKQAWPHLMDLQLADPHFNVPSRIDCIFNTEAYAAVVLSGIKRGSPGSPVALRTVFGWVLMGPIHSEDSSGGNQAHHVTVHHELSRAVERFWETEEISNRPILSPSEQECYDHFHKTHARDQQGRFIVRLPFVKPPTPLSSRGIAEACLYRLERRFSRQTDLFEAYRSFMREYLELGHMELMSDEEVSASDTYYLPYHPVLKNHDSSKIRVVFNASQKNKEGISLNSLFHTGLKLQEDVLIVIVRWSFFSVVFTCDVKKMFRQFLVNKDDADWQRIVWRETPEFPIATYRLLTVTYGTVPAPFLANACMLQLAEDEKESYPEGAEVLLDGRYVDDLFAGGDSVTEAMTVREQLMGILMSAGMQVGKWAANRPELLANLESEEENDSGDMFRDQEVVSTLGLRWLSAEDAFCFSIAEINCNAIITKRSMLSEIAKLYVPVGWLSPVIVSAKILLQNLWLQGVEWDDPVSDELRRAWTTFREQLHDLELIRIPRWYGSYKNSDWELHCFCDASERAYAVALYAVVKKEGKSTARLIAAKSKVSPIKVISLPRLELCGASLLARLAAYLLPKLERKSTNVFCWSDSKIVLAWLRSHPSRWKSFIANRVSEIISSLPNAVLNHVRSADNPADLATRGLTTIQLKDSVMWWSGPIWLQYPSSEWPLENSNNFHTDEEARGTKIFAVTAEEIVEFAKWFSKYIRLTK